MKHREENATCKVCRCATTAQSGFQPSIPSLNGSNPGSSTDPWLQWGPLARARVVTADSAAPSTRNSLPSLLSVTCLLHPPPEHLLPHVDTLCCGHTMLWTHYVVDTLCCFMWTHYAVSCGHTMLFHPRNTLAHPLVHPLPQPQPHTTTISLAHPLSHTLAHTLAHTHYDNLSVAHTTTPTGTQPHDHT
jgi:hypothetical protein